MSQSPVAIRAVKLTKIYRSTQPVQALRGVSLEIQPGERVGLLGKSGSGKSTLLNLFGGLDQSTSGTLQVAGSNMQQLRSKQLANHRSQIVGMIFQSFNLIPSQTALQNVVLPLIFAGHPARQRQKMAQGALERVGLRGRLNHRPAELSGGEQQRVAIARALVNEPTVLLADEPTGNLDSSTATDIFVLLDSYIRSHGTTLVMVTHDEDFAGRNTDRIIRLHDGQIVE